MAIIHHRENFRKGLRVVDRQTRLLGRIAAETGNGVVVWMDNGDTLYLEIDEARLRLASAP